LDIIIFWAQKLFLTLRSMCTEYRIDIITLEVA